MVRKKHDSVDLQSTRVGKRTIRVGKTHPYTSRENKGRGRVERIYTIATGVLVTLFDRARNTAVTVRPSQVGAA